VSVGLATSKRILLTYREVSLEISGEACSPAFLLTDR